MTGRTMMARIPVTAILGVSVLVLIDLATKLSLGPISANGAFTLMVASICLFLVPAAFLSRGRTIAPHSPDKREPFLPAADPIPVALVAFMVWAAVRLVGEPSAEGLQNVAVYAAFIASIAVTAAGSSASTANIVMGWMRKAAIAASVLYIASILLGSGLYGARSFALVALVYLTVLIPHTPEKRVFRLAPYLVTAAIVLSLSRTASLIALVLMLGMALRGKRGRRLVKTLSLATIAVVFAYYLLVNFQPLRDRFIGGDNAVEIGELSLNTSGRANLWNSTISSSERAPWVGQGPGSAGELTAAMFGGISHPHNEYLRILHDLGFIGLGLFIAGILALLRGTLRRALRTDDVIHWSASLALSAVLASAITDNPLVYLHVMLPVGVLVGMSLAQPMPGLPMSAFGKVVASRRDDSKKSSRRPRAVGS